MLSAKSEAVKNFHESFYGTPKAEESRRRRGKKRHQAPREEPQNEVAVVGTHYRSFDDDSMAAFVNSTTALVPWNGDAKLLIDRYDVRHLLQDLTGIRRRRARPPSPDATKEELDYERYRDVEGLENPTPASEDDELKNGNAAGHGYQRVGFDYSNGGDQPMYKERAEEFFSPPFPVPEHLHLKLPTSTKVHQIMAGTAKYVIEHGGQAEIVLRVKQANNPTFGFLMPDHYHHEYFRFLVNHPEHVGIGLRTQQAPTREVALEASSEEAEGGLSLLGTAYGDADDEDDDEEEEEEEEDKEGVAAEDVTQEQLVATGDASETVVPPKEEGDCNSGDCSTSKKSSVNVASEGTENAMNDGADSHYLAMGSMLGSEEAAGGVLVDGGEVGNSSRLQEPAPPGTEVPPYVGDLDHQLLPYREPPVHLRRIIDKMVEFISRNGKEFEAIVRERDKSDHRFPFLSPWNDYYPYYSRALEATTQGNIQSSDMAVVGLTREIQGAMLEQSTEEELPQVRVLTGVSYWDESWNGDANCGNEMPGVSQMQDFSKGSSHNGPGGMGFDAVLAAVRSATRGRPQSVEDGESADRLKVTDANERHEMGSDEAVMAAIKTATRGPKSDASGSGGQGQNMQTAGSSSAVSVATDPVKLVNGIVIQAAADPVGMADGSVICEGIQQATFPLLTSTGVSLALDGSPVAVAHCVAKAAAVAAADEGDSAEAQLTPQEKRKAERLKRAKLFAAMIKDGNGFLSNIGQGSGSVGVSIMPSLERPHEICLRLENTRLKSGNKTFDACDVVDPAVRGQTGEAAVQDASESVESGVLESRSKERKHKLKLKEQEEKQMKHHHKRKKDTEEKGNGSKQKGNESKQKPDTGEKLMVDRNHDHYQESKRKDGKYHHDVGEKTKDSRGRLGSEGLRRYTRHVQECEDGRKYEEEARKERRHYSYDSERKRKDRNHGHISEEKKIRSSHGHEPEEMSRGGKLRHTSEEKRKDGHHLGEKRKECKDEDEVKTRKPSRQKLVSEEKRGGNILHTQDSGDSRKKRSHSHSKRRKCKDSLDESYDQDDSSHERRSKRTKLHGNELISAGGNSHVERHQQHVKDGSELGDVANLKQELPRVTLARGEVTLGEEKLAPTPLDVPDDIRAKVRAMLAMI